MMQSEVHDTYRGVCPGGTPRTQFHCNTGNLYTLQRISGYDARLLMTDAHFVEDLSTWPRMKSFMNFAMVTLGLRLQGGKHADVTALSPFSSGPCQQTRSWHALDWAMTGSLPLTTPSAAALNRCSVEPA
eukprot:scaffold46421_cov20-Tisochrysis_lutea.AAC.1